MGKLKFGDGSTNFKRNKFSEHNVDAKGPMLYTSPAKQGFMDILGGDGLGGESKTKDIKAPGSDKKPIVIDKSKTEKVKPKKLDIVTENPETGKREKVGETNTSSRPEDNATPEQRMGSDYVTETPEQQAKIDPASEVKIDATDDTKTMGGIQEESKPEKKSLWQKFQAHHDSGEAMKVEAHFKDAAAVIAGDGRKDGSELHKLYEGKKLEEKTSQLATEKEAKQDAKDAINAQQKAEMHKSQLEVNKQNIAASKALEEQRKSNVKIQEEANAGENDVEPTDNTSKEIIKGSGSADSVINDKKLENETV